MFYSTNSDFAKVYEGKRKNEEFARVGGSKGYTTVSLSRSVVRKINLDKWAAVGYDDKENVLVVIPSFERKPGTFRIYLAGGGSTAMRQIIDLTLFFDFFGVDAKPGRYRVEIAPDAGSVKIFLNDKIGDQNNEQEN